ncbi:MAG: hypothetical protein JKY54_08060 [Flavobacteriales bacterium]|nr:hypothetical protein [Flavobacteriales bacterium]
MGLGEGILATIIGIVFFLGVYLGIKLFLKNKKDHDKMQAKNKAIRERKAAAKLEVNNKQE